MATRKRSTKKAAAKQPTEEVKAQEQEVLKKADEAVAKAETKKAKATEDKSPDAPKKKVPAKKAETKTKSVAEKVKEAFGSPVSNVDKPVVKKMEHTEVAKEPKPVVNEAAPKTPVIPEPESKEESEMSQELATIKALIKKYLDFVTTANGFTPNSRKTYITDFLQIVRYAMAHPTTEILEEVFQFFKQNRNTVLSPIKALEGIATLAPDTRTKLEVFYTVMCYAVESSTGDVKVPLDLKAARSVIKNNDIINFIASKQA